MTAWLLPLAGTLTKPANLRTCRGECKEEKSLHEFYSYPRRKLLLYHYICIQCTLLRRLKKRNAASRGTPRPHRRTVVKV